MTDHAIDQGQLAAFAQALFRYASEGVNVALRAFADGGGQGSRPPLIAYVSVDASGAGAIIPRVEQMAREAASSIHPMVFCPPIAGFKNDTEPWRATEADLAEAYALSVECDARPLAARAMLEALLGPATVVVASGGEWTNPQTGEVEDKLHLHWRLNEPATAEELTRLKAARRAATNLVGGDATNIPMVHPIRWPGSVHRKGAPRLARIVELNAPAEVELADVICRLAEHAGFRAQSTIERPAAGSPAPNSEGDYRALVASVLRGELLHDSLTRLAGKMVGSGMHPGAVVMALRGMMDATLAPHDDRWQARYDEIPRDVSSAEAKFGGASAILFSPSGGAATGLAAQPFDGVLPAPRQWGYKSLLPYGVVTALTAPPGTGKTTLAAKLCIDFALGRPFGPYQAHRTGPVWYLNNEDDVPELNRRIIAICFANGINVGSLAGRLYLNSGADRPVIVAREDRKSGAVVATPDVEAVIAEIRARDIKLVVVDPFAETFDAQENSNDAMKQVAAMYRRIAQEGKCCVLLVAHPPKSASAEVGAGDLNAIRGGGAIGGVARSVLTLFPMNETDAKSLGVPLDQRHLFVRLDNAKSNMSLKTGEPVWWRKVGVALGNAAGHDTQDEVGVLHHHQFISQAQRVQQTTNDEVRRLATSIAILCGKLGHTTSDDACTLDVICNSLDRDALGFSGRKAKDLVIGKLAPEYEIDGQTIVVSARQRGAQTLRRVHVELTTSELGDEPKSAEANLTVLTDHNVARLAGSRPANQQLQ